MQRTHFNLSLPQLKRYVAQVVLARDYRKMYRAIFQAQYANTFLITCTSRVIVCDDGMFDMHIYSTDYLY